MFKNVILALAFAAVASAARPKLDDLPSYTFARFVKDFHKNYSPKEMVEREKIFNAKLKSIVAINEANRGWKETLNEMADYTAEEFKARKGIKKSMLYKNHEARSGAKPKQASLDGLPKSVDWRNEGVVTSVKNQGHCGSCWTFGATEALESAVAIATGELYTLSEQQFVSCVEDPDECGGTGGCEGATMELAFDYAMDHGLVSEWTTPYTSYNGDDGNCTLTAEVPLRVAGITGYTVTLQNDYEDLMTAVARSGPVSITVDASQWSTYQGGVFDGCDQEAPDLDHGVLLVGYGTETSTGQDYWLVRNSWGPAWGEQGYIRLARTSDEGNRCGVDKTPSDGVGCAGGPSSVNVCGTCGILYDASYPTGAFLA